MWDWLVLMAGFIWDLVHLLFGMLLLLLEIGVFLAVFIGLLVILSEFRSSKDKE